MRAKNNKNDKKNDIENKGQRCFENKANVFFITCHNKHTNKTNKHAIKVHIYIRYTLMIKT